MFGANVYHLSINITYDRDTEKTVFQKEGNYGNNWNYGQILLNETSNFKVCQIQSYSQPGLFLLLWPFDSNIHICKKYHLVLSQYYLSKTRQNT